MEIEPRKRGELAPRIRALRDAGLTQAEIARQLGCSYSYVHDVYHSAAKRTTHGGAKAVQLEIREMLQECLALLRKLARQPSVIDRRLAELDSCPDPDTQPPQ